MIKKLRIFFTFTGIMLLLGAIMTDEWTSLGERISYILMGIFILAICHPSAVFRFFRWLWNFIPSSGDETTCEVSPRFVYEDSDPNAYKPPAKISRGNISVISDEEMNVFLRHYYKAEEIRTKVKGVTFRNHDGTDRQNILAHCHAGDQLRFKYYKYHGEPAYAVYSDWGQIGNLSAELAEEIVAREKPCIILGEILNVSGGYQGEYFGCNICLNIYEKL